MEQFVVSAGYEQNAILNLSRSLEIRGIVPALKKITLQ